MEQLKNYIRLGSFEEGYLKHCRLYGDLLVVDDVWYWYMSAYYPDSLDKYLYMKSGCFFLDTRAHILEWDDELGMYTKIPNDNDAVGCYNGCYNGTDI